MQVTPASGPVMPEAGCALLGIARIRASNCCTCRRRTTFGRFERALFWSFAPLVDHHKRSPALAP